MRPSRVSWVLTKYLSPVIDPVNSSTFKEKTVQPEQINQVQRVICHIRKQINPALQPNWIRGDVSSGLGVVVAEVVVMESCFLVVVLARESEWILNRLNRSDCFTKRSINRFPGDGFCYRP